MQTKHNNLATCGVISALKGSWEASPSQMLPDFKYSNTCSLKPAILLYWGRQDHTTPYKAGHPMWVTPQCVMP